MSKILSRILSCGNDYIASTVYKKSTRTQPTKRKEAKPRKPVLSLYGADTLTCIAAYSYAECRGMICRCFSHSKSSVLTVGTFVISKSAAKIQHFSDMHKYILYFFKKYTYCKPKCQFFHILLQLRTQQKMYVRSVHRTVMLCRPITGVNCF